VNWQRRPTEAEVAHLVATEEERRATLTLLADPLLGPPEFGPLPTSDGMTRSVYACARHAISLDRAALIHESTCTAPDTANLPGCDCTPGTPTPQPLEKTPAALQLPGHWITGA
jgi:hypothetical protein